MPSTTKILLLLGASSLWQAVSGYLDVYSHSFVFREGDPPLNPAHISLYAASLLGFYAVLLAFRAKGEGRERAAIRPGIIVATIGVTAEVLSGILNEAYHRVLQGVYPSERVHFSIHSLFVISMFLIAVGGLLSVILFRIASEETSARRFTLPGMGLFLSSLWLILLGSATYVTGISGGVNGGILDVVIGSFFASTIAVSTFLVVGSVGLIILSAAAFYTLNTLLLYFFAGAQFFLPLPVITASLTEAVAKLLRILARLPFSLLTGAIIGILSYWMLYPYSYLFFGRTYFPDLFSNFVMASVAISGALGGLFALALNRLVGEALSSYFNKSAPPSQEI